MPYWRLSGIYFTYFAVVGSLWPFWSLYLKDLGYDAKQIGLLVALPLITKLVASNLWGWIADCSRNRLLVIQIGALGGALGFIGVVGESAFYPLVVFTVIYSFFWNAILAQFEVVTLHYLKKRAFLYSRIRLWGSIGFIAAVIGLGVLFDYIRITYLAPIILFFLFSIFAFTCTLPKLRDDTPSTESEGFLAIVAKPSVMLFFLSVFLLHMSHGAYYTFYSIYLKEFGYSTSFIGVVWSIGVIAEIVLFIYMPQILSRVNLYWLYSIGLALTVIRWWLIGWYASNLMVLVFAQILHAASFGVTHAVAIEFVRRQFGHGAQSQGQALYSALSFGAGAAIGTYLSGQLWEFSPTWTFGIAALSAFCAWFLVTFSLKHALDRL